MWPQSDSRYAANGALFHSQYVGMKSSPLFRLHKGILKERLADCKNLPNTETSSSWYVDVVAIQPNVERYDPSERYLDFL